MGNRKEVFQYLFREGVCCAEKNYGIPKHPEINVPNLFVIKLMQSFVSKELVKECFSWRHYYWVLTDRGIEFLREYLAFSSGAIPCTLKQSNRTPKKFNLREHFNRGYNSSLRIGGDRSASFSKPLS